MPDLPALPDIGGLPSWPFLLLGALVLLAVLRRIPVIGTLVSLAIWAVLIGALVVLAGQREQLDPYVAQIAQALKLEDQTVVGDELRIAMSPDGHFWARVSIDGVERRMLVDSGATVTAVSTTTAEQAGLEVKETPFPVIIRTANGNVPGRTARAKELRLGNIVARDLPIVVSPAFGDTNVLGMNFLSRLKSWRVEGRTLILTPHNPQPPTAS